MKAMKNSRQDRNNLDEIDALIHERVFGLQEPAPKYSSNFALAMAAAEKVNLFGTIMLEKAQEKVDGMDIWHTVRKPEPDTPRLEAVSMGYTAAEAIARGCLVLKAQHEQSSRTNQYSSVSFQEARS